MKTKSKKNLLTAEELFNVKKQIKKLQAIQKDLEGSIKKIMDSKETEVLEFADMYTAKWVDVKKDKIDNKAFQAAALAAGVDVKDFTEKKIERRFLFS